MAQINSFVVNKQEVEKGETFTYAIWVKNTLPTAATLRVHFYENILDHELNSQAATVGGYGAAAFQLNLVADQYPGYEYYVCAWVEDGTGQTASECAPKVTIPEDSTGLQVTGCTVDKTAVDGGATVRYTMTVTNGSNIAQYAYVEFWDRDLDEVIYENESRMEPHETMTFEHLMVCATLNRRYRVCARLVNAKGWDLGQMMCAPSVQVSAKWGTAAYTIISLTARASRIEIDDPNGFGVTAAVKNAGSAGGSPMVLFSAKELESGAVIDLGGKGAYIVEGTAVNFETTSRPTAEGVYEVTATIEGTSQTKSVVVGVGRDPTPGPGPEPKPPTPSKGGVSPLLIMAGAAALGGAVLYKFGPEIAQKLGLGDMSGGE